MNKKFKNAFMIKLIVYLFLCLGAILMIGPFLWTLSTSLKGGGAVMQIPPQFIPEPVYWFNYVKVWEQIEFFRYTINSIVITVLIVTGSIFSGSFAGFGFSRMKFKGQGLVFFTALATLIMPYQALMIPIYFIWRKLGLLNTYVPLILPAYLGSAFGIFLFRQFFKSLPGELFESATIDGCNPFRIYRSIYLPLAVPAMATLGIFEFMGAWGEILKPLIYITSKEKYTLALGLLYIRGQYVADMELICAGAVLMIIPVVLVFLAAQKYFIQGIASTGLKG